MEQVLKKHSFKIQIGTIVTVILFVIGITRAFVSEQKDVTSQIQTMNNQYEHCLKWYKTIEDDQREINKNDQKQDLIIVEIKTKLNNIESMLLDIKKRI